MTELPFNEDRLKSFLSRATSADCIAYVTLRSAGDAMRIGALLRTYAAEVPVALSLLIDTELRGRRLLDVGAGIGLASFFLAGEGYDVTALEPGGIGFDLNLPLFPVLRDYFAAHSVSLLSIGAESLSPSEHGQFDVIFSANVLEHVANLSSVVSALAGVLSAGGDTVHTCPNYTVPYEPHLGLPLLPFAPGLTPWVNRRTSDVWRSLNFVTASRLIRLMRDAGLEPGLEKGIMARSIERLLNDPVFASRHPAMTAGARAARQTGALSLLRLWPARYATPMVIKARPRSNRGQG